MDKELLFIICMGSGTILFPLGGLHFKWLRRFLLPIILGIVSLMGGINPLHTLYFTLALILALHLGYGEKVLTTIKFLVFCAIFGSTCFLGWSYWQIISVVITFILFRISNTKWGQNIVFHKFWEGCVGFLLGTCVASLIGR